ncbi:MAG TPA: cation:proton antiporter [Methylophilaceae bacterium]|jgi:NhaP-type Na+/H+ or K+/H+ antiporter|nr:cation:proton antiporter [Methylophilaceae bacterium]
MAAPQESYAAQELLHSTDFGFFTIELYDVQLLLVATVILAAALAPRLTVNRFLSAPMVFMLIGMALFSLPVDIHLPNLVEARWPERLTEIGVLIALTAAGLKINNPFAWKSWELSWRLLAYTMPLTIAATALLGWWGLGMAPATALLLGAVIAPTDPVLASEVQTTAPSSPDYSRTRVALTTEAGMNDGLAFPFTNLAIAVALVGLHPEAWLAGWLVMDVFYRILVGALVGVASGWLLAKILFGFKSVDFFTTGSIALSLTLIPYALAELSSSYGFISVFIAACTFRQQESRHRYQQILHDFSEEMERILIAVLMFLIGAYIASGALAPLTWGGVTVALVVIFVVRPLAGMVAFVNHPLSHWDKWVLSFYGIRGIGSLYYLGYALHRTEFPQARELWSVVLLIIVISVIVHGLSAKPVMTALDRHTQQKNATKRA